MPALPLKILHFVTLKCLILDPFLDLMYKYMIWRVACPLHKTCLHLVR